MSRLEQATERVTAFLQERTKLTAIDPDVVYKVNHEELLTDDLLALVEAAHFMRVMLGINASARVEYAMNADAWVGPEPDDEDPHNKELAQANVDNHNRLRLTTRGTWPEAYVVQRIVTDWEKTS
ncbi:hypothetical protein [[Arthrobacter] sp. ATCC 21022]|uniref:Uncharacterized protein n=2 Tax=Marthavirus martha TaxID=1980950 RepID=A0A0U4JIC8_9CAUD|nr:hypothetical protein FDH49_gp63 [Arthrobacter phage Martha]ALY09716.1 hypothetical protein MARTHA_63 [Arthrobacter phage Martha]ALY10521.1 hypothetical protein TAEYOUNG_64 [Arthrobacter phage TaeYoung]KUR66402.1 hypothetical protein JM67_00070 [Arthrobacter sp. ATCC 21022]